MKRAGVEGCGSLLLARSSAGRALDQVSRLLDLGYPGGLAISKAALEGDREAFRFPRAMLRAGDHPYTFSFSGVKTAVARTVEQIERTGAAVPVADIATSFEDAVVDVLVTKALMACQEKKLDTLVIVGGVAANRHLSAKAQEQCDKRGIELCVPPPSLCTDNGAMIAAVGDLLVRSGATPNTLGIVADSSAVRHGAQLPVPA